MEVNNMEVKKRTGGGVGVTGLLQVAFIVLKLCGVIKWSWLWVLSPSWISIILAIILLIASILLSAWAEKL